MTVSERIAAERERLNLRPWEFAPSEIDDGECPYPPRSGGYDAWRQAQQWRAEIRARDPHYFDDDD
jgi:hypothetical protein